MRVELSGTPDFRFKAKAGNGYSFDIGASKSIGGDESGFRPMELLLAGIASCSAIDVVNILKKSRVEFSSMDIEVNGDRKDAIPAPFTGIEVVFKIHGPAVDRAKAEKAVSLALEKYCSVSASLDPAIKVTSKTILDS
ncbi:MAG: OsmC/Ohr family protein [Fibrobacteres bacterium]|nr:OsmC/Ohr family protein [Fibrobacterota bacterium]